MNAFALALGAAARLRKAFSAVKDILAGQAPGGYNKELLPMRCDRTGNVGKMAIYFPFRDA